MKQYISQSQKETYTIGLNLGKLLKNGHVISLEGPLGVGKTVFVKGIARALNIKETITSPTFTIMTSYTGNLILYHIDLYRIDSVNQLEDTGILDVLYSDSVAVIEWGEKVKDILTENTIRVKFSFIEKGNRMITVEGVRL